MRFEGFVSPKLKLVAVHGAGQPPPILDLMEPMVMDHAVFARHKFDCEP
jgi:hypothetical protein